MTCNRKKGIVSSYAGPYRSYNEYQALQLAAPFVWSSCTLPFRGLPFGPGIQEEFWEEEDPKARLR